MASQSHHFSNSCDPGPIPGDPKRISTQHNHPAGPGPACSTRCHSARGAKLCADPIRPFGVRRWASHAPATRWAIAVMPRPARASTLVAHYSARRCFPTPGSSGGLPPPRSASVTLATSPSMSESSLSGLLPNRSVIWRSVRPSTTCCRM